MYLLEPGEFAVGGKKFTGGGEMNATQALIGVMWLPALVVGVICIWCLARCLFGASKECEYPDYLENPYREDVE